MGLLAGKTLAAAATGTVVGPPLVPGDTHLIITPPLALGDSPAGQPIQIDSEVTMVAGGKRDRILLARPLDSDHASGAAITELNPHVASPGGAGGVPDPSAAPDGQVPIVQDGAYALASGISDVKSVRVTLSEAQILTLGDGVEIVPAIAGKILWPIAASAVSAITGPGYTASGELQVAGDNSVLAYLFNANLSLLMGAPAFVSLKPVVATVAELLPLAGLNLAVIANEGSPTLGEGGGGTIEVILLYVEIDSP